MKEKQIINALAFLKSAESLKDVLRSAHTSSGKQESTAEHSWRLCLWVMVFADEFAGLDLEKMLKICVLHDLGEAISGDVPATEQKPDDDRAAKERGDLATLLAPLPEIQQAKFLSLWDEYERGSSREGRIIKGFDKLETILQHNQGKNPPSFDYGFNLTYGKARTDADPLLAEIRKIVDEETKAHGEAM